MKAFFVVLGVILASPSYAEAYGSNVDPDAKLQRLQRDLQVDKSAAFIELRALPDRHKQEAELVIQNLDRKVPLALDPSFHDHHARVKDIVQDVRLSDALGNLELWWQQMKTLVRDETLKETIETYLRRVENAIAPEQSRLLDEIDEQLKPIVKAEVEAARARLEDPFRNILRQRLPELPASFVFESPDVKSFGPEPTRGQYQGAGVAGLLLLIINRIVRSVAASTSRRIMGKVLARSIPLLGAVLIAYEGLSLLGLKDRFESDLREHFLEEYTTSFTGRTVWYGSLELGEGGARNEVRDQASEILSLYANSIAQQTRRMIDSMELFRLNPDAESFARAEFERGRSISQVLDTLEAVSSIFGTSSAGVPIGTLLDVLVTVGDDDLVRDLISEYGPEFFTLYANHGGEIGRARQLIGREAFQRSVAQGQLKLLSEAFPLLERYKSLDQSVSVGAWELYQRNLPIKEFSIDVLRRIGSDHGRFVMLLEALKPQPALLRKIFSSDHRVTDAVRAVTHHPRIVNPFYATVPANLWVHFSDTWPALETLAHYRAEERGQNVVTFFKEISNDMKVLTVLEEYGLDGVRIWDGYVGPTSGKTQRDQAERALGYLAKGYPIAALKNPDRLLIIDRLDWIPGVGPVLYTIVSWLADKVVLVVVMLLVLFVAARILFATASRTVTGIGRLRRPPRQKNLKQLETME